MDKQTLKEKKSETVRRILDTATEIFADLGFAGARVDEIANKAGVNKATIYYRIGDKEDLYAKVLHDVLGDTARRIAFNMKEGLNPEEKLKTYIRNILLTMEQHPHLPAIMMQEIASGGRNMPEVVSNDLSRILGILMDIYEEGAREGVFIETNPLIAHLMVVGPIMFLKKIRSIKPRNTVSSELLSKFDKDIPGDIAAEIEKLVLRALKKS